MNLYYINYTIYIYIYIINIEFFRKLTFQDVTVICDGMEFPSSLSLLIATLSVYIKILLLIKYYISLIT